MKAQAIAQLPVPGSGCGNIRVSSDGVELLAEFEYRTDGNDWIGQLRFDDVLAYRFRREMQSKGYCSESFHAVAEVKDSSWLDEVAKNEPSGVHDAADKRHFAVFFSSNGYLEVIAERFDLLPPLSGSLS